MYVVSGTLRVPGLCCKNVFVLRAEWRALLLHLVTGAGCLPKSIPYLRLRRKLSVERCLYGRKPTMREPVASKRSATQRRRLKNSDGALLPFPSPRSRDDDGDDDDDDGDHVERINCRHAYKHASSTCASLRGNFPQYCTSIQ